MKYAIALVAVAAGFLQPLQAASKSDYEQIAAVTQGNITGFMHRDLDLIMKSYSTHPDLIVFDITPPLVYKGPDALRKLNERWLATFKGKIEGRYDNLNIKVVGDLAYGYNFQYWTFTQPDGSVVKFTARLSDVYQKENGQWRIIQEHGSVPVELQTATAVLNAK